MALSKTSIEILADLVEIKMLSMEMRDHEDERVMEALIQCRHEIIDIAKNVRSVKLVPLHDPHGFIAAA